MKEILGKHQDGDEDGDVIMVKKEDIMARMSQANGASSKTS